VVIYLAAQVPTRLLDVRNLVVVLGDVFGALPQTILERLPQPGAVSSDGTPSRVNSKWSLRK